MQNTLQAGGLRRKSKVLDAIISRKAVIIEIISAIFILLFVYTAISKLSDTVKFTAVLRKSPLIGNFAPFVAWGIPLIELLISLLLFIPKTKKLGLTFSLLIMVVFTAYLGYMIYFTPNQPCSCGGVLSNLNWKEHLVFNLFFVTVGVTGVSLSRNRKQ